MKLLGDRVQVNYAFIRTIIIPMLSGQGGNTSEWKQRYNIDRVTKQGELIFDSEVDAFRFFIEFSAICD